MTLTPVAPNLYQIVLPTPFPVGPVNVYLADAAGEPLTLVDTGPRTEETRGTLERGLAALGYTLGDVERVIVSHAHSDHYGLAGDIIQISGASVYSHPHNRPTLEDYAAERTRRRAFYTTVLAKAGVPQEIQAAISRVTQSHGRFATATSPVRALDEGDEVELAGRRWRVLYTPGHTGGVICLYQPETRLLLSNDHLLRDVSSNPLFEPPPPGQTRRRRALVDYITSLERTAALEVAVAWPGHGEPITDHRALIKSRLAFHRRRADKLLAALDDGPQTVYASSRAIFRELNTMEQFLAVSEVLAHLEWLEERGELVSRQQGGLVHWDKV